MRSLLKWAAVIGVARYAYMKYKGKAGKGVTES